MIREGRTRLIPCTFARWGPDWTDMEEAAELIGGHNIIFELQDLSEEDVRRGVDIMPELTLYDEHFRPHKVTYGQWVIIYPGFRNFRVVDSDIYRREFQEFADGESDG